MKLKNSISNNKTFILVIILSTILYMKGNYMLLMPVSGHAGPIAYQPQPNQIINSTQVIPDEVIITFSERPELKVSIIRVTDFNDTRIDNNDLKVGDSEKVLTVKLNKSKLIFGDYTINWLVLSKDDGFITKGSYVFSYTRDEN
ncbi:copper resistance CopC family protein [Candidatus Nitrosocosmicus sp. T]